MLEEEIIKALEKATGEKRVQLEFPENEEHGDYSSNIALILAKKKKKKARDLAEEIAKKILSDKDIKILCDKVEAAGPGFINFWLAEEVLVNELKKVVEKKDKYGRSDILKGKTILLEHTSPNTIKLLHVGHIRNNVLGMAVHNLLEFIGAEVKLDAVNNDRGIHVMKAVWAYQKFGKGKKPKKDEKPDHFVDQFYTRGAKEAEDTKAREEMQSLLRKWEKGDKEVRTVWRKLKDWTFNGFEQTYKRLGSQHNKQWFESDFYKEGKIIAQEGLKKKVFKKLPNGAILSNLKKYKLSDAIILRADGTSMYHTQDLRLTQLKREKFPSDFYIWDIGPEQSLYLKQLFAMCEQLGIGKREDYYHLSYGFVFLKSGEKMSSRRGNVISADWLMDEMVKKAKKIIEKSETPRSQGSTGQASRGLSVKEKDRVAEVVGIGAIKYGFLKPARETDIHFDMDESLALEGNSGPYLQYTVARTNSVLMKSKRVKEQESKRDKGFKMHDLRINKEELALLRSLPRFSEVIKEAASNYAPNLLCNYLFDLAKKYNAFYNKHRILDVKSKRVKEQESIKNFRINLTAATGQVLKNGLRLLGIQAPERM